MKNKKGFTLTEILVVIAIIGIILAIAIPASLLVSKSIKQRAYEAKWTSLIAAAELYGKNNKDAFGEATQIQITVETLLANGYITEDANSCERAVGCIIDPKDEKTIMNDEPITIKINKSAVQAAKGAMTVDLKIYFAKNGAEIGVTSLGCSTLNGSVCTVKLPSITRSGYTIIGWNENALATTPTNQAGEDIELSNSNNGTTYYAITSKTLTATFDKNNASAIGVTSVECRIYNSGTSCNIVTPTITASSGYSVVGWNTSASATVAQYAQSSTVTLTSNIIYYAITKLSVTCRGSVTYVCPTDLTYTLSGTTCTYSYTTTNRSLDSTTHEYLCGYTKSGSIVCDGAGGTWSRNCVDNGQCDSSAGEGGVLIEYKCRSTCTTKYVCDSGYSGGGTASSKCTKTTTAIAACTVENSVKDGDYCYLYYQTSCPSGWTEQ